MTTDILERAKRYVDVVDARIDAAQESRSRGTPGSRAELKAYRTLREVFYEMFPELDGYGKKDADDAQREELRSSGHCDTPIGELKVDKRAYVLLQTERIETIGDLLEETEPGLLLIPGLGRSYLRQIKRALADRDLYLKELID